MISESGGGVFLPPVATGVTRLTDTGITGARRSLSEVRKLPPLGTQPFEEPTLVFDTALGEQVHSEIVLKRKEGAQGDL